MSVYGPLTTGKVRPLARKVEVENGRSTIYATLTVFSLDHVPAYSALSYAWQDPSAVNVVVPAVRLNNHAVSVGSNLAAALLLSFPTEWIWADAICINQLDLAERGQQVAQMRQIYRQAQCVVVWLGRDNGHAKMAFNFVRHMNEGLRRVIDAAGKPEVRSSEMGSDGYRLGEVTRDTKRAFINLCTLRYWRRAWIIQEIALSENVIVTWGEGRVSWRDFLSAFMTLNGWRTDKFILLFVDDLCKINSSIKAALKQLEILSEFYRECKQGQPTLDFILGSARSTEQTDPRDSIYAKLGMARDGADIVPHPEYTSGTWKVYRDFVRAHIETTKTLGMICLAQKLPTDTAQPSWVPNFASPGHTKLLQSAIRPDWIGLNFRAAGVSEAVARFLADTKMLHVEGFIVDTIETIPPERGTVSDATTTDQPFEIVQEVVQTICHSAIAERCFFASEYDCFDPGPEFPDLVATAVSAYETGHFQQLASACSSTLERTSLSSLEQWIASNTHIAYRGASIGRWLCTYYTMKATAGSIVPWDFALVQHWTNSMLLMSAGRKLITTKCGQLCLMPEFAQQGDLVCMLYGCYTPVVLRREGETYRLLGECYVHGMMRGEAVEGLVQAKYESLTFAIA